MIVCRLVAAARHGIIVSHHIYRFEEETTPSPGTTLPLMYPILRFTVSTINNTVVFVLCINKHIQELKHDVYTSHNEFQTEETKELKNVMNTSSECHNINVTSSSAEAEERRWWLGGSHHTATRRLCSRYKAA